MLAISTGDKKLPVASIAIPMRSLINPVLPAGLEFAVVDVDGAVLFHSDTERNVNENFLAEADQHPRLRSLIAARSAGHVNIDYWGRPYRAHVKPSAIDGWSVITLFDDQHARALALEWAAASLVLLTLYMGVCVVVLLVVFKSGTAWLWPDPKRRAAYPLLVLLYAASIGVFGIFAWTADSTTLLYAGGALPAIALAITILVLAVRPEIRVLEPDWSALTREYHIMAALGLVLTAVVPGIAIVAFSHDLHMQSFIKHRQIGLAHAMASRQKWRDDDKESIRDNAYLRHPLDNVDNYADVFFETRRLAKHGGGAAESIDRSSIVHSALEDYMPYLSPFSVEMRELSHDHADDGSWQSQLDGDRLVVTVGRAGSADQVELSSLLPTLTLGRAMGAAHPTIAVTLGLAFLGLAFAIAGAVVGFVLRRVFLSDIVEPIPAIRELLGTTGQDMFVVCNDPAVVAGKINGGETLHITPMALSANLEAAWRQVQAVGDKAGPARAVVIRDLDASRDQVEVMRRKLRLIEGLMDRSWQTVVLLSRVPPQVIAASARGWRGARTDQHAEQLLARFQVFNWPGDTDTPGDTGCLATWWSGLVKGWKIWLKSVRHPSDWCKAIVDNEKKSSDAVERICGISRRRRQ